MDLHDRSNGHGDRNPMNTEKFGGKHGLGKVYLMLKYI